MFLRKKKTVKSDPGIRCYHSSCLEPGYLACAYTNALDQSCSRMGCTQHCHLLGDVNYCNEHAGIATATIPAMRPLNDDPALKTLLAATKRIRAETQGVHLEVASPRAFVAPDGNHYLWSRTFRFASGDALALNVSSANPTEVMLRTPLDMAYRGEVEQMGAVWSYVRHPETTAR